MGIFTDAEIGSLVKVAISFEENHGYPLFNDRAMNIACKVIYEDQSICDSNKLTILKAAHGSKITQRLLQKIHPH